MKEIVFLAVVAVGSFVFGYLGAQLITWLDKYWGRK